MKKARAELSQRDTTIHQLEEQNDWQNLSLLEKDALIKEMEQRLVAQQLLLDDAIQEVVRVKAKQRSLESRAEAASEMAEAEIALKSLREQAATEVHDLELSKAEQLLKMAAKEFENENFGGTLYLIDRAKGQIKVGTLRVGERDHIEGLEGEVPFAVPLSLLVSIRSNLREGPGTQFKVLVTLDQGASITGYSSKGAWVRVQSHEGWIGWIHLSLVSSS